MPCAASGILDCDVHYGNGTDDIMKRLGCRVSATTRWVRIFAHRDEASLFERWLDHDRGLPRCRSADLQAGADPHVNDPLGKVLTGVQMAKRDHAVFSAFQGRPLVWNLAGGYQRDVNRGIEPVLKLHRTTAQIQGIAARRISPTIPTRSAENTLPCSTPRHVKGTPRRPRLRISDGESC